MRENMDDSKCHLRLIGDIHGHIAEYEKLLEGCEYSLQIGDMAIRGYAFDQDPERHKFFGGNHDNYDMIDNSPNNLGDFGVWDVPDFGPIFWVRGGFSVDYRSRRACDERIGNVVFIQDWWEEEEISHARCYEALDLYKQVKPKILVSHECPLNIVKFVCRPDFVYSLGYDNPIIKTKTNQLLQAMTDYHAPKLHVFGHYHQYFDQYIKGSIGQVIHEGYSEEELDGFTRYVCIEICGTFDLPVNYVETL